MTTFDEWFDAYERTQPYECNRAECEAAWQASRAQALREAAGELVKDARFVGAAAAILALAEKEQ